jgi:hypothetical protein
MDMTSQRNLHFQSWAPFVFCVLLTIIKQFGGAADPAYYSFLPMCFFGVGAVQLSLLKRIKAIESARHGHSGEVNEPTRA